MKIIELNWSDLKALRLKFILNQKTICPICKKRLTNPVLDHQHKKRIGGTGRIRKVICSTCNIFLGKIENNCKRYCISQEELPKVLINVSNYLKAKQTNYLHPSEKEKPKKLGKREYNKLCKYYFKIYPTRRKLPQYPKSKKLTKRFEIMLEDLNRYLKENK